MKKNFSLVTQVIKSDKKHAFYLAKSFYKQDKAIRFDRRFRNGVSKEIGIIYFRITPACNLRCLTCSQRGTTGVLKGKYAAAEAKKILPPETYKKVIDDVGGHNPVVYIWGGEPFLYPHLTEVAEHAVKRKCVLAINTNGLMLKKYAERIVSNKWTAIYVSLDGFEEINDNIRGPGSYEKVMEGLEAINKEKKRQKSKQPYLSVVTVVSNRNYLYLDKLAAALKKFDLTIHIINLGTYSNDKIILDQKAYMKKHLGIDTYCLEGFNNGYNEGIDGDKFAAILQKVHDLDNGYPIVTVPAIKPDKIGEYYSSLTTRVKDRCIVPWSQVNIDYNGNVHFCADYPEYILGNIQEQSIWDIYNGERAKKFRDELKKAKHGIFPGCIRCYQNMLFGKSVKGYTK